MDELKPCPMKTSDIIEVLRICAKEEGCADCPHEGQRGADCLRSTMKAAADRLEELNRRAAPENKPTTHCRDCTNYHPLSDYTGRGKCPYYNEQFDVGDDHFCGYAVEKAHKPEGSA